MKRGFIQKAYPAIGSSTMALGSSSFSDMSTFLEVPFRRATSIRSVPVSVQYTLRAIQSTAMPSGLSTSVDTIVSSPTG